MSGLFLFFVSLIVKTITFTLTPLVSGTPGAVSLFSGDTRAGSVRSAPCHRCLSHICFTLCVFGAASVLSSVTLSTNTTWPLKSYSVTNLWFTLSIELQNIKRKTVNQLRKSLFNLPWKPGVIKMHYTQDISHISALFKLWLWFDISCSTFTLQGHAPRFLCVKRYSRISKTKAWILFHVKDPQKDKSAGLFL